LPDFVLQSCKLLFAGHLLNATLPELATDYVEQQSARGRPDRGGKHVHPRVAVVSGRENDHQKVIADWKKQERGVHHSHKKRAEVAEGKQQAEKVLEKARQCCDCSLESEDGSDFGRDVPGPPQLAATQLSSKSSARSRPGPATTRTRKPCLSADRSVRKLRHDLRDPFSSSAGGDLCPSSEYGPWRQTWALPRRRLGCRSDFRSATWPDRQSYGGCRKGYRTGCSRTSPDCHSGSPIPDNQLSSGAELDPSCHSSRRQTAQQGGPRGT